MTTSPTVNAPGRVFISYRREDTAYPAGWLYERLADRFGDDRIFKDVDSIDLGDDFVDVITRAVASCDVLLVLIGEEWSTIHDAEGRRRLDDRDDFVRLEIEVALNRDVRIIPVLVDGARMPGADELPDSLARLVRKQSLELSPGRFEFDTGRLMKVLDSTLAESRSVPQEVSPELADVPGESAVTPMEAQPPHRPRRRAPSRTWILAAVGVAAVVIAVVVTASLTSTTTTPTATTSTSGGAIQIDSTPATSDGLKLTGLSAVPPEVSRNVGDTVTVSYSLTNVSQQDIQLVDTFVGVRNPDDENMDAENDNEDTVLAPGESVTAQARVFLDSEGTWTMWPCYTLASGDLCPDRWKEFWVIAG